MELLNFKLNELSVLLCFTCRVEYVGREVDYVGRTQIRCLYLFGDDAKDVLEIKLWKQEGGKRKREFVLYGLQ